MTIGNGFYLPLNGTSPNEKRPPELRVMGENGFSDAQLGELNNRYLVFRSQVNTSVAPYHTTTGKLSDGSIYKVVSHNNVDTVFFYPVKPGGNEVKLPHGFGVKTNWGNTLVYGRDTTEVPPKWKITVPAVQLDIVDGHTGYSVQEFLTEDRLSILPLITGKKSRWRFVRGESLELGTDRWIPVTMTYTDDRGRTLRDQLAYLYGRKYIRANGTEALVCDPPDPILYDEEPVRPLYPEVNVAGDRFALQSWRYALVSPTFIVYTVRYRGVVYKRNGPNAFQSTLTVATEFGINMNTNPVSAGYSSGGAGTKFDAGMITFEEVAFNPGPIGSDMKQYSKIQGMEGSYGSGIHAWKWQQTVAGHGTPEAWFSGDRIQLEYKTQAIYAKYEYKKYTDGAYDKNESNAFHDIRSEKPAAPVTLKLGLYADTTGIAEFSVILKEGYPLKRKFFRAGADYCGGGSNDYSNVVGYPMYINKYRINAEYQVAGEPTVELRTSWLASNPFYLHEANSEGYLKGRHAREQGVFGVRNLDVRKYIRTDPPSGNDSVDPDTVYPGVAVGTIYTVGYDAWDQLEAMVDERTEFNRWRTEDMLVKPDGQILSDALTPTVDDYAWGSACQIGGTNLSLNKITYEQTSRHVIDFDGKSRFLAAIEVKVKCENAERRCVDPTFPYRLVKTVDPTYTVTISFVWRWGHATSDGTASGSIQLCHHTCTREGFEFVKTDVGNPWVWPGEDDYNHLEFYMPPYIKFPLEGYRQLEALCTPQNVNPHFVGHQGLTGKEAKHISKKGVEFSRVQTDANGVSVVTPPSKSVEGMLYARSFKLNDFPDALWLLTATMCDAYQNPFQGSGDMGPKYYYMPEMRDALEEKRHIELRNGIHVQWSDDIPHKEEGKPQPEPYDRNIELFHI